MQKVLNSINRHLKKQYQFYLIILLPMIYLIIFHYIPMLGASLAFKDYNIRAGIWGSEWVGFKYFQQFFTDIYFTRLMRNTFLLGLYNIIWGFPIPIILALLLTRVKSERIKKAIQLIIYAPNFISVIVIMIPHMTDHIKPCKKAIPKFISVTLFMRQPCQVF